MCEVKRLVEKGFENIYDTYAGGTVSSHCGPNTIGVLFIDTEEVSLKSQECIL